MEVCGGQTCSIVRYGLDRMLPPEVELVHGPGCPVCVTALETIDRAHAIARSPASSSRLSATCCACPDRPATSPRCARAAPTSGVVYSPLDAVALARANPDRRVVFFGIGFETTAPANAMALIAARRGGVSNFSMLASHVLTPPVIGYVLQASGNRVQAFLGPGHVSAITGSRAFEGLARRYRAPIVVTGFEPLDLLEGILMAVRQLEEGRAEVEVQYARGVTRDGNPAARAAIEEVFEITDRTWRGVGAIPKSGYRIAHELRAHDAERIFDVETVQSREPSAYISGLVLRGQKRPSECPAFGRECTPRTPLGATMVSSEGACAAYFQHGRHRELAVAP
ncbi:MAG: hydrogenase formation protein HypD [Sandaracinaceae bacterium]|nr:hydrogenase formation protein HypD [Sandaracinaceae bacterium]